MKELEYTTQSVPKGKRFCTICGQVKRLHYFEGDSTHCSDCCEKMLHTRVHGWIVPILLAFVIFAALSGWLATQTVPFCLDLFRAEAALRDNRLADASSIYSEAVYVAPTLNSELLTFGDEDSGKNVIKVNMTLFEAGTRTWTQHLKTYAALYSEYEAASLAEGSLDLHMIETIPKIAALNEAKTAYDDTLAFAEEIEGKYTFDAVEEMPYDEIIADLTAHADASDSLHVKGYIEYFKGRATQFYKPDDPAASKVFYEKMLDYLPDEFMTVYTSEAEAAYAAGDYEAVIEAFETILAKNKNYTDAYPLIAEAAFLSGNTEKLRETYDRYAEDDPMRLQLEMRFALRSDDLKTATQVRERARKTIRVKADAVFNNLLTNQSLEQDEISVLSSYINFALYDTAFSLVEDDLDEAFRIVYEEAFNYAYYYAYLTSNSDMLTQSVLNMATLCASLAHDESALKSIKEIGECDETTQQVIDGELSVRDVFVEGKAEII